MLSQIGAGAVILMGTAAAPMGTWNGGTASNADLTTVSPYLTNFNIQTSQGTVDVTKLTADADAFFRKFIAGLRGATASAKFGDDAAGTFERRIDAIQAGVAHVPTGGSKTSDGGRGKVDMIIRPAGTATGKIQYRFTCLINSVSATTEIEGEIGGDLSVTIDGQIIKELQP